jgi:hypothetical protein
MYNLFIQFPVFRASFSAPDVNLNQRSRIKVSTDNRSVTGFDVTFS